MLQQGHNLTFLQNLKILPSVFVSFSHQKFSQQLKLQCVRIGHLLNSNSTHTLLLLYVTGVSVITQTVLSVRSCFQGHLFLQLAELSRHGLQADSRLLQLLVCRSDQVAAPVGRLTGIFQLTEETTRLESKQNHPITHSK